MYSIQEVREKFPQYNHLSDKELGDALYKKYYANKMSKQEYDKKINSSSKPETSKGWKGVAEDALQGIKDVPSALISGIESLPSEAYGALQQVGNLANPNPNTNDRARFAKNLLAGLGQMGHGIINTPANIADYFASKDILPKNIAKAIPRQQEHDYAQLLGIKGKKKGDALIQGLIESLPYGVASELGAAGKLATPLKRGASGAAFGVGQNQNPAEAALLAGGVQPLGKGIVNTGKAIKNSAETLTPSGLISRTAGKNIDLETLQNNLRASEGVNTPLGDILESPTLKKTFENHIAEIPGSGADTVFSGISNDLDARANQLINGLLKKKPTQNANTEVKNTLLQAKNKIQKEKNAHFNEVSDLAKQENITFDVPEFKKLAKKASQEIGESPLIKNLPKYRSIYNKLMAFNEKPKESAPTVVQSKVVNQYGKPFFSETEITKTKQNEPSLSEIKLLANEFGAEGQKMLGGIGASDRAIGNLYSQLAAALRRDAGNAIKKGSPELVKKYQNADKYYQKVFAPIFDKGIFRHFNPESDADAIIRAIINPSKDIDKHTNIEKIQSFMPESKKNLLGYGFLKGAEDKEGNLIPEKVVQRINSLGNRQFKALFPNKKDRENLLDYVNLRKMNSEALSRMVNPKTGARNVKTLNYLLNVLSAGAGGIAGGIPGVAAGLAAPAVASNYLTKLLTNEQFRNKVAGKISKQRNNTLNKQQKKQDQQTGK